jgi:hypothetical protein
MNKGGLASNCNWEHNLEPRAVWATKHLEKNITGHLETTVLFHIW